MKEIYTIGQVAKLKGTTIKTLRYYDEINLLKPAYTAPKSGYRYYTYEQLFLLEFILMLKNSGASLKEISQALQNGRSGIIDLCEKQINDAKIKLIETNASLFKFHTFSDRIKNDQSSLNSNDIYLRQFPERSIITSDCPYSSNHKAAHEVFDLLCQRIRNSNLNSFYSAGHIMSINEKKGSFVHQTAFIEAYPTELSSPENITQLPAGTYFCIVFEEATRTVQLSKILQLLTIMNRSAQVIVEAIIFRTALDFKDNQLELQILI